MWILYLVGLVFLLSFAYAASSAAPWVPTRKHDVARIIDCAQLKSGERFVELGCGNGRVCRAVARAVPGAQVEGVELSLAQFLIGWVQTTLAHVPNMRLRLGNLFHISLREADVVYLFLMPEAYQSIRQKCLDEMKEGARLITYVWPMPDWEPIRVDRAPNASALYVHEIKKNKA